MSTPSKWNAWLIQHCYNPYGTTHLMKTGKKGSFGPKKTPFGGSGCPHLNLNTRAIELPHSTSSHFIECFVPKSVLFLKPSVLVFLHIFYTRALLRKDDCNSNFCLANALPYSFKPVSRQNLPCSWIAEILIQPIVRVWRVPATLPNPDFIFTTHTLPGIFLKFSGFRVVS